MNIKLNQFVKKQIISRAESLLGELQEVHKVKSNKTQQQRDLDTIFARHPGEGAWKDFADVVKALIDYRPTTVPEQRKNFQVVVRCVPNAAPVPWIILKNDAYGFATLNSGCYTLHACDRLATVLETEDFIDSIGNMNPEELYNWVVRNLGVDALNVF